MKFHENSFGECCSVSCGRTDRQTDDEVISVPSQMFCEGVYNY